MTDRFTAAHDKKTSEPLPLENEVSCTPAQRIWIGNMDTNITEYTMLQLLKKLGKIQQFDFLLHKTGPQQGQSRGFCFVSFEKENDAARAIIKLNHLQVMSKRLQVRWAHNQPKNKVDPKETLKLPEDTLAVNAQSEIKEQSPDSNSHRIKEIEAKLQQMEKTKRNPEQTSSSTRLHPLLAKSKLNATLKQSSHPYYRKKRHKR